MLSALKNADNFLLCAHINPDGDAVGSMLAAGRLLERLGKTVTLVCQDPVPEKQRFLAGAEHVLAPEQAKGKRFDAALALDVATEARMGAARELFSAAPLTFQIDHHPDNTRYAQFNQVDGKAAATAELIVALYDELNVPLDAETARQLYCALVTDTGNFAFSSVRANTFACMEKLMAAGLDIDEMARRLLLTKSRAHAATLGKALTSLKYFAGGEATCMHLTRADMEACGASAADLHGIVNYGLNLEGVRMTFMADEGENAWQVSLRALPGGNVAQIAAKFGGGGHVLAAGCRIQGSYEEVEGRLIAAVEEALL